ncbi:hypothetical protein PILCRDRAFT_10707 [Piloderma croceum F 1598]|uniref:Prolyl 4-hydroxylase alpha subunit Fe(2+) 2OG dioxygenase domain-containing protein n=1 Tax=Piloderma croceum (strain F 1598) TaxID=765440 RepID=A0A0C3FGS6_PILCF|nr:hypothetical protein PILCRDRAFT_10707 [Piloderma croceum F 1598]
MTTKRPLSNSSLAGGLPSDPASVSRPLDSRQLKKTKVDNASGQDSQETLIPDPVYEEIRSAINIKKALNSISKLRQLGYCPTKVHKFRQQFGLDNEDDSHDGSFTDPNVRNPEERFRTRDLANQAILDDLKDVCKDIKDLSASHACGSLEYGTFDLRITRPGCEYTSKGWCYSREIEGLLHDWFEHSAISGYGDMHSLETKVDCEVRNAREIPASEFEVTPALLQYIQNLWREHFLPRSVRAEPYKIHLYGPGGHFKSHRDTPETGLVGTFLVGLGDTSSASTGHFRIGNEMLKAHTGSWVAFHPDVPHEITKLEDGYRAVVAFKIFRAENDSEDTLPAELQARMKTILDQIPAPFGLFTTHQYSIGTTSLNGFDALLSAYARSRHDTQAHMLPVVTKFYGEAFFEQQSEDEEHVAISHVYPFTGAHVDILLNKNAVQAKKEVQWLDELSEIPFYTWDLKASSEVWQEDYPEGVGYTGNEADSSREDSIYLSYAILFLPRTSK